MLKPVSRTNLPTVPNDACISIVKRFEGLGDGDLTTVNLDPYMDSVGVWTIGWGHALKQMGAGGLLRGEGLKAQALAMYCGGITKEQACVLLGADLIDAAADVARWLNLYVFPGNKDFTLTNNQHGALTSWFFNLGYKIETLESTLLKRVKAGRWMEVQAEFGKWRMAGGKVERGLVYRRECEAVLFGTPDDEDAEAAIERALKRVRAAKKADGGVV